MTKPYEPSPEEVDAALKRYLYGSVDLDTSTVDLIWHRHHVGSPGRDEARANMRLALIAADTVRWRPLVQVPRMVAPAGGK